MEDIKLKRSFACPLCGKFLEVRESKKGKPYVICDDCGMQMFVRGIEGIKNFAELTSDEEPD